MAGVAAVTLIVGVIDTPLAEWSGTNYLFGAVLIFFAAAFAIAGFRGTFNLVGRLSRKTAMILAVIGTAGSLLVIVTTIMGGQWNVGAILTTGM